MSASSPHHRSDRPSQEAFPGPASQGFLPRCRAGLKGSVSYGALFFVLAALLLSTGCSSNRCQDLCESYYQMQLRCDLFGRHSSEVPSACADRTEDPQSLQQSAEYSIRQCRQDFRNTSSSEQQSCCKASCFSSLLEDYNAIGGDSEIETEQQRDLCRKYRQLVSDGSAPWCTALQQDCLESQ